MLNPNDDPELEEELEHEAKEEQKQKLVSEEHQSSVSKEQAKVPGPKNPLEESFNPGLANSEAAHEQEYLELQEENFEEFSKWHKNLEEVVQAMRLKRDALLEVVKAMENKRDAQGSASESIRILIMVLGGAMQGPYGAGQMCALQEMGYTRQNINNLDAFLGISAGASTCAFGMAGKKQALLGTSYFYTICASKAFLNYMRIHQVVDVSIVEQALRSEPTKLDVEAVRQNPAQFYVQAYNVTKKQPEFIDAKNPRLDMVEAIHGSMAIPVVYNKSVSINGSSYTDGAFDDPLPIVRAIGQFSPTHILILPNMPFNRIPIGETSKLEKAFIRAIPLAGSLGFLKKVLNNRQALRQTLETIAQTHKVKIGVAWPPEMGLGIFTQNTQQIKAAIKESAKKVFQLFGEGERELKLYEEDYPNEPLWQQKRPV